MYDKGIIKAILCFCIGLIVCSGALAEEIPWPLAKDYSQDTKPIDEYIKQLGTTTNSKAVGATTRALEYTNEV